MPNYIIGLMSLVVLALAVYAASLVIKLLKQKRQQADIAERQALERNQSSAGKRVDAQASIEILIRCLLQDQVSLTEAAIRVSALAKTLGHSEVEQSFYKPFDSLAMATSHIPILQDWAKLSNKERKQFDSQRAEIESEHRDTVMSAAKQLVKPQ